MTRAITRSAHLPGLRLLFAAGLLSFVPVGQIWAFQGFSPLVEVAEAEERTLAPMTEVPGTVISLNDSQIASEVEGPLIWVANVGDSVAEGDVIARIDDRLLRILERQAAAEVKRLEADLSFREREVKRFSDLAARDTASKARLDEVSARRAMLAQDLATARALYERARGDLDRAEIKAPFEGHIAERLSNVGEFISVGENLVRLVDTAHVEISLPAPIELARFTRPGMTVSTTSLTGADKLPVRTVVPVGDAVSRMLEVRLEAPSERYIIGSAVRVALPAGDARTMTAVTRDAIVLKGSTPYIFVVDDNLSVRQVRVERQDIVGLWVGTGPTVRPGDRVVVRGGERLVDGQTVTLADKG